MVASAAGLHRNSRLASGGPSHSEGTPLAVGAHQPGAANPVHGLVDYGAERRRRVAPLRSGNLSPQGLRELAGEPAGRAVAPGAARSPDRAGSRLPCMVRQPGGPGLDVAPDSRRKGRAGGPPALLPGLPAMPDPPSGPPRRSGQNLPKPALRGE